MILLVLLFILGISTSIGYGANLIDRDLQSTVCNCGLRSQLDMPIRKLMLRTTASADNR